MTSKTLTNFQLKCEVKIQQIASSNSVKIISREIEGNDEAFIHIKLDINSVEIWVYEEECMFSGENCEIHFEKPDYNNNDELIADFIKALDIYIKGGDTTEFGSGFVKLFNLKDI